MILAAFDSDDELHGPSQTLLVDPDVTLTTLDLARYEVANVAVRGRREFSRVAPLLEAIDRISGDGGVIPSTTTLLSRAAKLADEHTISVYDAAYVAAADQAGGTLVSCDIRDLVGKGLRAVPRAYPRQGRLLPTRAARSPVLVDATAGQDLTWRLDVSGAPQAARARRAGQVDHASSAVARWPSSLAFCSVQLLWRQTHT